jgi:hypothetical protein
LLLLLFLSAGGMFVAFRQGLIPARYSPLPIVNLAVPNDWLIDWRLAELKGDREFCGRVLRAPYIEAEAIPNQPIKEGCGWTNNVRISALSGAKLSTGNLSCESAAALALWVAHDVQPLALEMLGQRVVSIRQMGTYSCRNIVGNPLLKNFRSAHATANAIDIAGFVLADGREIDVEHNWPGEGKEASFLKSAHQRACRYFRVAIGPEYNAAHKDHFHLDRGIGLICR